jgi:4-amino-4-deoxy-L-arabinose transferase-like glycosyltransferase
MPRLTPARARAKLSAVPPPLAALLAVVLITTFAWALVLPPLQAPDENSHFGYAQRLSESFDLPGDSNRKLFSTEQELAQGGSNSDQTAGVLQTKPEWSVQAYRRWQAAEARLPAGARDDGGGPNPASTNPPLYYLYEAPAYLAGSGGDIFDRLYLMRLWSALLALVTVTATWLLAGELFGPRRPLQLVAAAVAGLQPMVTFLSAAVTPDSLLFALWSLALWLGVRILKRGLTAANGVALLAAVGLAVVTKASSYALVPAALLALGVGAYRLRVAGRRRAVLVAIALLAFAVPVGGWLVTARALDRPAVNEVATAPGHESPSVTNFNVRELGSYMWQFYLPRLPFQKRFGGMPESPVYTVWLKTGWGAFGWLEVRLPQWVYALLGAFTLAVLLGGVAYPVRRRREVDLAVVAFLGASVLTLLAGLHWTEFRTLVGGSGPFNQGRYLLPLIGLMGAAVAATVALVPERRRMTVAGLVLGGMFALQAFSLAIVIGRFYA